MQRTFTVTNHVSHSCCYRVVWCPKYRRAILVEGVNDLLRQIIIEICQQRAALLFSLDVMPEYVDLLVSIDPHFGIHRLIKLIKGRSSRLLREAYPNLIAQTPALWTNRYFVATTGDVSLDMIRQYIARQKYV